MRTKTKKIKVLVLGGSGMLGHKVWQTLSENTLLDVVATIRESKEVFFKKYPFFSKNSLLDNVDAENFDLLSKSIENYQPEWVVNCIGVVKQDVLATNKLASLKLNSYLPHWLAKAGNQFGFKLIHISSDCVFSGKKGGYTELDTPDPVDIYGMTKYLGEVDNERDVVIRTSIIGFELGNKQGLLEWFLNNTSGSTVLGYKKAIFSGLTTLKLADVIEDIIVNHPQINGLWHVGGEHISKYQLLLIIKEKFGLKINITPDSKEKIDRSLVADRFWKKVGSNAPNWNDMIASLLAERGKYEKYN